jgi:hypothetical protein
MLTGPPSKFHGTRDILYSRFLSSLRKNRLAAHRISAGLDQNVEHVAVLVDRAPQLVPRAADPDEHFVALPFATARSVSSLSVRFIPFEMVRRQGSPTEAHPPARSSTGFRFECRVST